MATNALRDVSKAPRKAATAVERLAMLIDEAGTLRERRNELDKALTVIREQIQGQIPIPEPGEKTIAQGYTYEVVLQYKQTTTVDLPEMKKLLNKHPNLFWRLVKIGVGDLEKALTPEEFHSLTNKHYAEAPTLDIKKRK